MAIDSLLALLQPPEAPCGSGNDWAAVETELGIRLPSDYKRFAQTYGSGTIDNFVVVLTPFAAHPLVNLLHAGRDRMAALAELRSRFPADYRHDVFPAAGGLLPFAITDNANVFCWKTVGAPDAWTVVVYEGRGPDHFEYAGGMSALLVDLLAGALRLHVLPKDFPSGWPVFRTL